MINTLKCICHIRPRVSSKIHVHGMILLVTVASNMLKMVWCDWSLTCGQLCQNDYKQVFGLI